MRSPALRPGLTVLVALAALVAAPAARADLADETALAERFAPVVRLVEQPQECGPGEPYVPTDVDVLFDEPTVALRGPTRSIRGATTNGGRVGSLQAARRPSTRMWRATLAIAAGSRSSTGSSIHSTTSTICTRAIGR
jgi:hypothetical protein